MNLTDTIANLFLSFSHIENILIYTTLAYFFINPKLMQRTIILVLLTIIITYALKVTFKVPLHPSIGHPGFAFPSTHMSVALTFYGYPLIQQKSKSLYLGATCLFIGIAISLVHFNYHNYTDILGALIVSTVLISLFKLMDDFTIQSVIKIIVPISIFLLLYTHLMYGFSNYITMVSLIFYGYVFGSYLTNTKHNLNNIFKIGASIIFITATVIFHEIAHAFLNINGLRYALYLLTGLSLPMIHAAAGYLGRARFEPID